MATFAIWNPLDKHANAVLSNGNLTVGPGAFTYYQNVRSTVGKSSGKWYWEYTITMPTVDLLCAIGKSAASLGGGTAQGPGGDVNGYAYHTGGQKYNNGSYVAYGAAYTTGDVISIALDMDAGNVTFYKNGVSQGVAFSGLSGTIYAMVGLNTDTSNNIVANFGASTFVYTPPGGFNAGLYSEEVPTLGLIAGYKFSDLTDSVGSNTLTNTNGVTFSAGKIGNAANFGTTNTNKVLEINGNLGLTSTGAKSISGWVKMNTEITSSIQTFFGINILFGANWSQTRIEYDYNGGSRVVRFGVNGGGGYRVVNNTVTLGTTNWNHFVLTYSGGLNGVIRGYVNGVYIGQAIANITGSNTLPDKLQIGALYNNFYASALIDVTHIYNREIDSIDVSQLYNGGEGIELPMPAGNSNFFMFF